jgi:hypothetical protein
MISVFHKQTYAPIRYETGIPSASLATASVKKLLFIKPDKTTGSWDADADGTKLVYEPGDDDLNVIGIYKIQSYVVIDGKVSKGSIRKFQVKAALKTPS